jgi:hypothetical protein
VRVTRKNVDKMKIFGRNWVCEKMEEYGNGGDGKPEVVMGDGAVTMRWCSEWPEAKRWRFGGWSEVMMREKEGESCTAQGKE